MQLNVGLGQVFSGLNAQLELGGSISGVVTGPDGRPLSEIMVWLRAGRYADGGYEPSAALRAARTDSQGRYTARGLATANWALEFFPIGESPYRGEFWSDKGDDWDADQIQVRGTGKVTGKNVQLAFKDLTGPWATVTRLAGGDRYTTAVAISASRFSPGVSVAYIANGRNFPDALAAGPVATATNGPVLLSAPNALPAAVRSQLSRLRPTKIVILGEPDRSAHRSKPHLPSSPSGR